MRHLTKRRLTGQAGFVLPTAVIVLLILTVLIGAAVAVATQTSTSTTRDNNTKAALEAAEAGLQAAAYRLSKLEPKSTACINGTAIVPETSGSQQGECKSGSEPLGNGARFEYWTTKGLAVGETCGGETMTGATGSTGATGPTFSEKPNVTQRCITSLGTVNGVERRLQERTALSRPPLFEINGMFGYESVSVKQNAILKGAIGTNGTITLTENDTVTEVALGPTGTLTGPTGGVGAVNRVAKAFERPPVPIGESAVTGTAAECIPPEHSEAAGKNCDFRLPTTGPVKFNTATRALNLANGSKLVLQGGIYNFCSLEIEGNNAEIETVLGERVEIFIDSAQPPRAGVSGCTTNPAAGKVTTKNGLEIFNPNPNATYLQLYVYDGSGGTFEIKNNSGGVFDGTIVAPESTLKIGNGAHYIGAIIANKLELGNKFEFTWEGHITQLLKETTTNERKAWEECPPTHTGTNPREGC